jgi:predicted Zn-dependent peptidase
VSAFTADDLQRVHRERYHRGNIVIAPAGNIEHARFVEQVARVFNARRVRTRRRRRTVQAGGGRTPRA